MVNRYYLQKLSPTASRGGSGLSNLLDRFRNFQTNSFYAASDKGVKSKPADLMIKVPSYPNRNGNLDVAFGHPSVTLQPREYLFTLPSTYTFHIELAQILSKGRITKPPLHITTPNPELYLPIQRLKDSKPRTGPLHPASGGQQTLIHPTESSMYSSSLFGRIPAEYNMIITEYLQKASCAHSSQGLGLIS
jgi:hypothetical protein